MKICKLLLFSVFVSYSDIPEFLINSGVTFTILMKLIYEKFTVKIPPIKEKKDRKNNVFYILKVKIR